MARSKNSKTKLTPEQRRQREATRMRNKQIQQAQWQRELEAAKPQVPLCEADFELIQAETTKLQSQIRQIETLRRVQAEFNKAIFELRHPESGFSTPDGLSTGNTVEQDILAMEAVSRGFAEDMGNGLLKIDVDGMRGIRKPLPKRKPKSGTSTEEPTQ